MYTLKIIHSQSIKAFHVRWWAESVGSSPAEDKEALKGLKIIEAFRNLFKDTNFVTKVQDKIHNIGNPEEQARLMKALTEVLAINKSVEQIHEKVRGQLFALLWNINTTA